MYMYIIKYTTYFILIRCRNLSQRIRHLVEGVSLVRKDTKTACYSCVIENGRRVLSSTVRACHSCVLGPICPVPVKERQQLKRTLIFIPAPVTKRNLLDFKSNNIAV